MSSFVSAARGCAGRICMCLTGVFADLCLPPPACEPVMVQMDDSTLVSERGAGLSWAADPPKAPP
jgi:hypothetical protein